MRFWGITGTNGKTTTAWIAAEFINACKGLRAGHITTVEAFDGVRRFYTGYTTPPLEKLKEIYAAMEANGCTDCVMEVSSHAIHQNRVGFGETTTFAGGAFTNLSEDHLDYHKTMEEYFRVKLSFAERIAEAGLRARGWEGAPPASAGRRDFPVYAVCLDGGYGREMLAACGRLPLNVIPVSCRSPRYDLSGLRLIGDYNRSNVLVAAAIAEAAGVPCDVVQRRFRSWSLAGGALSASRTQRSRRKCMSTLRIRPTDSRRFLRRCVATWSVAGSRGLFGSSSAREATETR